MEQKLFDAADGDVEKVKRLLKNNPRLDVNWRDRRGETALHVASLSDASEVVQVLLAQRAIKVNVQCPAGFTPFSFACSEGSGYVVILLLKDPRVHVTLADRDGCTPLWHAAYYGRLEVIEWIIASGRNLGNLSRKGKDGYTALEIAREKNETETASLLKRFMTNPRQTRHEVRVKLGILNRLAAEFFSFVVFLCDDLLRIKPRFMEKPAARFLAIATALPIELQMLLCHRVVVSERQNIPTSDSEAAFLSLAKSLLLSRSK